ncbi:hypothetical protein PENSPDRAFT_328460 [Peniophora sp. CONT]|nr:hypothetical protein PENSPDRAFT_328460 [Peniophora sp. CONT]
MDVDDEPAPAANEALRTTVTLWRRKAYPEYTPSDDTERLYIFMSMIYRCLLVDLFSPGFSFEPIWDKLGLDSSRPLTLQYLKYADVFIRIDDTMTLKQLADEFIRRRNQIHNPVINQTLRFWYERKDGQLPMADFLCTFSPTKLDHDLVDVLGFWKGERAAKGVGAARAGRMCPSCQHNEYCRWRLSDGKLHTLRDIEDLPA